MHYEESRPEKLVRGLNIGKDSTDFIGSVALTCPPTEDYRFIEVNIEVLRIMLAVLRCFCYHLHILKG